MIVYLDISAVIPLLIAEPSSSRCIRVWNDAQTVISTRLLYVEMMAALSQGRLAGRLSEAELQDRIATWMSMWAQFEVRALDAELMVRAGVTAQRYGLRGYDSVNSAAAVSLAHDQLVAVSGDCKLLTSWQDQGVATLDTNAL